MKAVQKYKPVKNTNPFLKNPDMKEFPEGIFSLKNTLIHNHSHWLLETNLRTRWCNYLIAHVGVTVTLTMPVRKKFCKSYNTIGNHTRRNMETQDQKSWDAIPRHCEDCRHLNLHRWIPHPATQTDSKRRQETIHLTWWYPDFRLHTMTNAEVRSGRSRNNC